MREMLGSHRAEQMKHSLIQEYNTALNKIAAKRDYGYQEDPTFQGLTDEWEKAYEDEERLRYTIDEKAEDISQKSLLGGAAIGGVLSGALGARYKANRLQGALAGAGAGSIMGSIGGIVASPLLIRAGTKQDKLDLEEAERKMLIYNNKAEQFSNDWQKQASENIDKKEKAYVDIKNKIKSGEKTYAYTGEALGALGGGLAGAGLAKLDGSTSKGFGAITGGLMGGIMGNLGGRSLFEKTNEPLHSEYKKRFTDFYDSVPPLADLDKQADANNENQIAEKLEQIERKREEMLRKQHHYELGGGAAGLVGGLGIGSVIGHRTGYGAAGALGGLFGVPVGNFAGNKLYNLTHKGDINEFNGQADELNQLLNEHQDI